MKTRKRRGVCLAMAAVMTLTSLGFFGCGTSDEAYQLERVSGMVDAFHGGKNDRISDTRRTINRRKRKLCEVSETKL